MTAEIQQRRNKTAREVAAALGCSERTVRRVMAEPLAEFVKRSRARQDLALELKEAGLKYREIGERLGCTTKAVEGLVYQARKRRAATTPAPSVEAAATEPLEGQVSIDDVLGD